jgi:predicted NBD/HSP70 family sugar kinase
MVSHNDAPDARKLLNARERTIKAVNRRKIVRAVMVQPSTQVQIARRTDLSQAKVSAVVQELVQDNLVTVHDNERGKTIRLREVRGLAAGVDVGHERLTVAVRRVDDDTPYIGHADVGARHGMARWIAESADLIRRLSAKAGLDVEHLVSIGLGIPAAVSPRTAQVTVIAPALGWDLEGDPRTWFAGHFPEVPVVPDNDANFSAFGEYMHGAGRDAETMVFVKASTGIGAGIVNRGYIYRGRRGLAGEIGHYGIAPGGAVCNCGRRGCLETVAGGPELLAQVKLAYRSSDVPPPQTLDQLVELAAMRRDRVSLRIVQDAGRAIGAGIVMECNTLDPDLVVLGGELGRAGEVLREAVEESLLLGAIAPAVEGDGPVIVRTSALGMTAGALGALSFALLYEGNSIVGR